MRAGHAFLLPTFTINLLEARIDRCSSSLFEKVFHSCAFIEGSSSSTMPIIGALFLSALPGLAIMFWNFSAQEKKIRGKDKPSPKRSSTDMSDVDEQSAHTASKSDLQAAIGKLKYHANSDKNKKGSADDKRNAKDLLAHYKKIQSSSARADFVEKLKRYGVRGMPKMLEVVESRTSMTASLLMLLNG